MKRILAFVLIAALVCCAAMALAEPTTYTVKSSGYGGEMEVVVTFDGDQLTAVELGENHETSVVRDRAMPVITERLLEAQTAQVDSVSAATFTSYGVKAAVADAARQHGLDYGEVTFATKAANPVQETPEDVTCQIVIVGGGPSGLSAAIAAKENGAQDVLVIEKLDILSGNGKFDMNFYDLVNSQAMQKAGIEDSADKFYEDMIGAGNGEARTRVWADVEATTDAWLRSFGVTLDYTYGMRNHMENAEAYAGEHIQAGMEAHVAELGVQVRTGTKGVDLIMEDGVCKGVVAQKGDATYNIYAEQVILATGGFSANKELLAKYAPGYEVFQTSNQMGATGDFVKVFEKNGFMMENMGKMSVFANIIVPRRDLTGGADMNLFVNKEGALLPNKSGLERGLMVKDQTDGAAFYMTDKTGYDSFYRIRKHVGLGYYAQGETLEELAAALGIDAEGLKASVAQYNEDAKAGVENAATGAVPKRALDAEGPYYGVRVETANHMTKGGVVANENAQVLNADGTVVPGLYAAGEVTWQSGGYSESVVFGKVAGEHAAAALE